MICAEVLGLAVGELAKGPQKLSTKIGRTWGIGPIFLDFGKTDPSSHYDITELARAASGCAINPIVIVRTHDDEAFLMALQRALRGNSPLSVAIRVHYADLEKQFSAGEINSILLALGSLALATRTFVARPIVEEVQGIQQPGLRPGRITTSL